jgi:hypothetical protein
MDMREFLDKMAEEGEKVSGGGSLGIVGKVLVQFGVHRFVEGHEFWEYWLETKGPGEISDRATELAEKLRKIGVTDKPNFGIRVTVFRDVLSAASPYKKDLIEFTPKWQSDAYKLIEDSVFENKLPVGEEFLGQVQYKPNPYHVAKGEAGKTDKDQEGNPRWPSVRVPVRRFADEAEARAFVEANGTAKASQLPPFSETAKKNYPDLQSQSLMGLAEEIHGHLAKAQQGIPFMNDAENHKLPEPATPPNLKAYIAGIYDIEPGDIDLLRVDAPF